MELGKLVTAEEGGCIFYFIIDDVHPDEPHQDSLRHYYVVANVSLTFSYREAYGVLCRALCSLENRTFLHRWHSLFEQIFGTTPYVQFVNEVRNSPLVCLDIFSPEDEGMKNSSHDNPAPSGCLNNSTAPNPTEGMVALFSNETAARLALRHMTSRKEESPGPRRGAKGGIDHSRHQQVCCTPVHARHPNSNKAANHFISAPRQPVPNLKTLAVVGDDYGGGGGGGGGRGNKKSDGAIVQEGYTQSLQKVDALLNFASSWKQDEYTSAVEAGYTVHELQRQLMQERERRVKAEEHCQLIGKILDKGSNTNTRENMNAPAGSSRASPQPSVEQLEQQLRKVGQQRSEERAQYTKEREELISENSELKRRLEQKTVEQNARIEQFLRNNENAVKRTEDALVKREEDVRTFYSQSLQERDVRIARLSQEILQHTHEARQLSLARNEEERLYAQRTAHLEDIAAHLRDWNLSLQRQLADTADEARRLRQRLEVVESTSVRDAQRSLLLPMQAAHALPGGCVACGGLPRPQAAKLSAEFFHTQQLLHKYREENMRKSEELIRAANLIDALKDGLRQVRAELAADLNSSGAVPPAPSILNVPGHTMYSQPQLVA